MRSTVFPGTCEQVVAPRVGSEATIVFNPEFLREGTAVRDFVQPSLLVVGGADPDSGAARGWNLCAAAHRALPGGPAYR